MLFSNYITPHSEWYIESCVINHASTAICGYVLVCIIHESHQIQQYCWYSSIFESFEMCIISSIFSDMLYQKQTWNSSSHLHQEKYKAAAPYRISPISKTVFPVIVWGTQGRAAITIRLFDLNVPEISVFRAYIVFFSLEKSLTSIEWKSRMPQIQGAQG